VTEPNSWDHTIVNFVGDRVALGPLRRDLLPTYTRWRNDFTVARTLNYLPGPFTAEEREAWFARASSDSSTVRFTIYERAIWRPIGIANLHDVDSRHGTAELGLMIGESDARGRGLGTEASCLMLDYAFTALGLHNVMLRVYAYNPAGLRAYQKAGFREFGRRSASRVFAGRRWDEVYMECLASEFVSPVLDRVLASDVPRS
jgi:diamine N-acetyltransferase